jgi:hypothetical protein
MSNRRKRRLVFDLLEGRMPLTTTVIGVGGQPLPVLGIAQGSVASPGARATTSITINPENLAQNRHSTQFAFKTFPDPGTGLAPVIVGATAPDGRALPIIHGEPFSSNFHPWDQSYVLDDVPGPLTLTIAGRGRTTGSFTVQAYLPGDTNGDHRVDFADLVEFNKSFNSHVGDPRYSTAADATQNGFVGHDDGNLIVRNLSPLTPPGPLTVSLHLAPGEQIVSPRAEGLSVSNSGGLTRLTDVTVLGHTTPGSIVYIDNGLGDYKFNGGTTFADANGNFSIPFHLSAQLTNTEYLIVDPYQHQTIRAFPIMRIVNKGQAG